VASPRSYGAKGDGIADDTLAMEKALAASVKRYSNGLAIGTSVYTIPPGLYRITRPLSIKNIERLVMRGEPGLSGILLDSKAPCSSALDLCGVSQSVFEGMNIGSTDATVVQNLLHWYYDGAMVCSRVRFSDLHFGGAWVEAAVQVGAEGVHANGQCDNSYWENVVILGKWSQNRRSGCWRHGIRFGTGTFGNCLIHDAVHLVVDGAEHGITVAATNATVQGGSVGSCRVAFSLQAPSGYTRIAGVRVEGATRLIETGPAGGATIPCSATVEDCTNVLPAAVPGNLVLNRGYSSGGAAFTDPSAAWQADVYAGKVFRLFDAAKIWSSVVVSNDAQTLMLVDPLPWAVGATYVYAVSPPVTSATPVTLTDTTQSWPAGAYAGLYVVLTAGLGAGQWREIAGNDATELQVTQEWGIVPNETSGYAITSGAPDGQWIQYQWPGTLRLCNVSATGGLWFYEASLNPSIHISGSVRQNSAIIDGMAVEGAGFASSGNGVLLVRMFYGTQGGNVMPEYTIVERVIGQ
jgi:hypothetical protein